jgi:hypothetical protein
VATRGKSFRRVASTSQTPKIQPQTGEAGNCCHFRKCAAKRFRYDAQAEATYAT